MLRTTNSSSVSSRSGTVRVVPEMDGSDVALADDRQGRADSNSRVLLQVETQEVVKRKRQRFRLRRGRSRVVDDPAGTERRAMDDPLARLEPRKIWRQSGARRYRLTLRVRPPGSVVGISATMPGGNGSHPGPRAGGAKRLSGRKLTRCTPHPGPRAGGADRLCGRKLTRCAPHPAPLPAAWRGSPLAFNSPLSDCSLASGSPGHLINQTPTRIRWQLIGRFPRRYDDR